MGLFHDTTAAWKSVGEDGTETVALPEDWEASLTTAYDADIAASGELAAAKVASLEEQLTQALFDLKDAKAANWDLIQSKPIEADSSPENSPNNAANANDSADGTDVEIQPRQGIDSLFETKD